MCSLKKMFCFMLILLFALLTFSFSAHAATANQDGLILSLTTEKEKYGQKDEITISVTVENTNAHTLTNVKAESVLPQGLVLKSGEKRRSQAAMLAPGGKLTHKAVLEIDEAALETMAKQEALLKESEVKSPWTGDDYSAAIMFAVFICGVLGIFIFRKWRGAKKLLSLFLCVFILAGFFMPVPAYALENEGTGELSVGQNVSLAGYDFKLSAKVTYDTGSTGPNIHITELTSDTAEILAGESAEVVFTARIEPAEAIGREDVILYDRFDRKIGVMNDSGLGEDALAGDGIYTLKAEISNPREGTLQFYAGVLGFRSATVDILSYTAFTSEQFEALFELKSAVSEIENRYADENGLIPRAEMEGLLSEVSAYAEDQLDRGKITAFTPGNHNVWMRLSGGIQFVFAPAVEGLDAVGSEIRVTTCRPFDSVYSASAKEFTQLRDDATEGSALRIAQRFPKYSYAGQLNDRAVTLEAIKSFSAGEVILWYGHGGFNASTDSFLSVGDNLDEGLFAESEDYRAVQIGATADYLTGRIIVTSQGGRIAVTPNFFDKYLQKIDGAFIYLGSCESGRNAVLANSFLNKGASSVVANSGVIFTEYNLSMMKNITEGMLGIDAKTGKYRSVSLALDYAKETVGQADGNGTKPVIFGAGGFRLENVAGGRLSGRICEAENRNTPISDVSISVYEGDRLMTELKAYEDGRYEVALPRGKYRLVFSKEGFINGVLYAEVLADIVKYNGALYMLKSGDTAYGKAGGTAVDVMTGRGIQGARILVRADICNMESGEILYITSTDNAGNYSVSLPYGNYTVIMEKEGYILSDINITVSSETLGGQDCMLVPVLEEEQYAAVLTWEDKAWDLDAHLIGLSSAKDDFHVHAQNPKMPDEKQATAEFIQNDSGGEGFETIVLMPAASEPYYYYVNLVTSSGIFEDSGAKVRLYRGEKLIAVYHAPTGYKEGEFWNVFSMNGRLNTAMNTISGTPPLLSEK